MGGHIEQQFRHGIVLAEHGEGTIIRGTGGGGDALGHLFLHHDGDGVEALRLQQGGEDGRGNVVRQISAGHGPEALEFFRNKGGNVLLQHVAPEDFQVVEFPHGHGEDGL